MANLEVTEGYLRGPLKHINEYLGKFTKIYPSLNDLPVHKVYDPKVPNPNRVLRSAKKKKAGIAKKKKKKVG